MIYFKDIICMFNVFLFLQFSGFLMVSDVLCSGKKGKNNIYKKYQLNEKKKEIENIKKIDFVREKLSGQNKNKLRACFSFFVKYQYGPVISFNIIRYGLAKSFYNKAKALLKEQSLEQRKNRKVKSSFFTH